MAPLGMVSSKKPLPLMATSSSLPVTVMLPWVNICVVAATVTPMPTLVPPETLIELA